MKLAHEEELRLAAVAETVVKNTVNEYNEHLTVRNGVVDERQWKKIKQRDDMRVYRERNPSLDSVRTGAPLGAPHSSRSNSSGDSEIGSDNAEDFKTIASMVAFGSIEGNLDDVMYGAISPSTEAMQLKTAYTEDGFVDWELLAPIITPSANDPYRELSVKRFVKPSSLLVGTVMRPRSALFIESNGIAQTPNGERIGYHVYHSIDVPEIRELPGIAAVRSKLSFTALFRQRRANCVEVFIRGAVDPMGVAPAYLIALSAADVALAVSRNTHYAEMKKLTRILSCQPAAVHAQLSLSSSSASGGSSTSGGGAEGDTDADAFTAMKSTDRETLCGQCRRSIPNKLKVLRSSSKEKNCAMCGSRLCSKCRVHKTIFAPSATKEKELTQSSRAFCMNCLACMMGASSATFASLDARAAKGEDVDYASVLSSSA